MSRKVFVIGVGMTKFEKPGSRNWDYPDMAKEAGEKALADAGISVRRDRAGGGRLLLRRLDLRAARRLPARPHRRADLQREQQLRHRLDGAVHGQAVRRIRPRRLRHGARLREDGEGLAGREVPGPHQPDGQAVRADGVAARLRRRRRRRRSSSATPAASTWTATAPRRSTSPRSAGRTTSTR